LAASTLIILFEKYFEFEKKKQGVCHNVTLPFTLKSILRQKKKNYGNSNISPCKNNYNLSKKSSIRKPKSIKILLLLLF
jgi:hypothetical protein